MKYALAAIYAVFVIGVGYYDYRMAFSVLPQQAYELGRTVASFQK